MLNHLVARGYTPGSGVMSPEGVFCLHIPKNASTYLTNLLVHNGWQHTTIGNPNITKQMVVLRDPIDRWVSGFATYAASWLLGPSYGSSNFCNDYTELTSRLIFDQIVFDDHTTHQVQFVDQLNKSIPTTQFALNAELFSNLNHFLNTTLDVTDDINHNSTDNNYDTKTVATHMKFIVDQNPTYKAKLINCYKDDYELMRNTNFYDYYNESR